MIPAKTGSMFRAVLLAALLTAVSWDAAAQTSDSAAPDRPAATTAPGEAAASKAAPNRTTDKATDKAAGKTTGKTAGKTAGKAAKKTAAGQPSAQAKAAANKSATESKSATADKSAAPDKSAQAKTAPVPAHCAGLKGLPLEQCQKCDVPGKGETMRFLCRQGVATTYCVKNALKGDDPDCRANEPANRQNL